MIIHPPEKRKNYFVSRVTNAKNRPFSVSVSDARIVAIHTLSDDAGYSLRVWIPPESGAYQTLEALDKHAMQESIDKNKAWFSNALTKDTIYEYFRPSLSQQVCNATVSSVVLPRTVSWCGTMVDDFESIVQQHTDKDIRMNLCQLTLEVQGLYFHQKRFGIRWIVRDIQFYKENGYTDESNGIDDSDAHRYDIEQSWEHEIAEVKTMIETDIASLQSSIEKLEEFESTLKDILQTAKSEPQCTSTWEDQLGRLRTEIFRYKSGRL
jgi:hypothetical protein